MAVSEKFNVGYHTVYVIIKEPSMTPDDSHALLPVEGQTLLEAF